MAAIWQVVWQWTGTAGGTGYSNLFFASTQGSGAEALQAATNSQRLFDNCKGLLPPAIHITCTGAVRLIDDVTGDLVNIFTVSGVPPVTGTAASAPYSAPSGACVDWLTGVLHGKHLMTGRTFLVPLAQTAYDSTGSVSGSSIITIGNAAENMRTATGPRFGVWGRPRPAQTVGGVVRPALNGFFAPAISSRVPIKAVVMRSRRD